jgi:indole-3-glycerol phosphate synthase
MAIQQLDTERILAAKRERLSERQGKVPAAAVLRLAEMQRAPYPLLNVVTGGDHVTLLGQVTYGEVYDPVGSALHLIRAGVDAIAFFTDTHVYDRGLDDLLLVSRGIRRPVLYQNYVLDEYHVAETRAAGAAAVTLYASLLEPDVLRQTVSIALRWRMATVVQVETREQLEQVSELSPHAIAVGNPHQFDTEHDLALLDTLRPHLPRFTQVMLLGGLTTLDHVQAALNLRVDALMLGSGLIDNPDTMAHIHERIRRIQW